MPEIRKPAVKIQQGKRSLLLTSFTVGDFMKPDFYRVDRLDIQESKGMQRLLNTSRARSFGKDIKNADDYNEAFLPTSVFLATSGSISYDEKTKELFFESDKNSGICPLDVVDGQHRIEGLKMAAVDNERLRDFPISVVIADNLSEAEKMLQFVTVNTKQKTVDAGVAQHITARFSDMLEVENLPYLPSWLRTRAEKKIDAKALEIARRLNSELSSPWCGRIHFADEPREQQHTVNQASFVKSIQSHILSRNHPLCDEDVDRRVAVLKNFWIAVNEIFVGSSEDVSDSVAFKTTGLEFFLGISARVINILSKNRSYTKDAFKECLLSAQDYLDAAELMSPDFWRSGSYASGLNKGAVSKLAATFSEALSKANSGDIQI